MHSWDLQAARREVNVEERNSETKDRSGKGEVPGRNSQENLRLGELVLAELESVISSFGVHKKECCEANEHVVYLSRKVLLHDCNFIRESPSLCLPQPLQEADILCLFLSEPADTFQLKQVGGNDDQSIQARPQSL